MDRLRAAGHDCRVDEDLAGADLAAAVTVGLAEVVDEVVDLGHDTSDERWFSNRVRGDTARQVGAVWIEP